MSMLDYINDHASGLFEDEKFAHEFAKTWIKNHPDIWNDLKSYFRLSDISDDEALSEMIERGFIFGCEEFDDEFKKHCFRTAKYTWETINGGAK